MHTQKLTINLLAIPPYFKSYNWKKTETEADKAIAEGHVKSFKSAEELLTDLKK